MLNWPLISGYTTREQQRKGKQAQQVVDCEASLESLIPHLDCMNVLIGVQWDKQYKWIEKQEKKEVKICQVQNNNNNCENSLA